MARPTMRKNDQVSDSGQGRQVVPLCGALPEYPHQSVKGRRFCELHEAEYSAAINAWYQACFRARQSGEEEPKRELYEQRIKYTWPDDLGKVLTEDDRHQMRQCADSLASAATTVTYMPDSERLSEAQMQAIRRLVAEVRKATAVLQKSADIGMNPVKPDS